MRVPLSWLREFVDVQLTPEQLAERLTLLGMEVKHIERWGADWQNVVTGQLLTVERHPRADRLHLTTVTLGDGGEPLSIVCGATNIAPGQRIPVALPGAVLPGNRRIERAEKMGVVSNGMLCSGEELRLTGDGDGILILPADTPLGVPLVRPLRRHGPGRRRQAEPRRRAVDPRPRAGGRGRHQPAGPRAGDQDRGGERPRRHDAPRGRCPGHRPLPAVRRPVGERRDRRARLRTTSRCGCSPPASARSRTSWTPRTT